LETENFVLGTKAFEYGVSDASFEAFMTVMFQAEVFWVVTPCSVVVGYERFGGPCRLHLQFFQYNYVPQESAKIIFICILLEIL
jgi:hypothetical protein